MGTADTPQANSFDQRARAYERICKVARTIADLDGAAQIQVSHFA